MHTVKFITAITLTYFTEFAEGPIVKAVTSRLDHAIMSAVTDYINLTGIATSTEISFHIYDYGAYVGTYWAQVDPNNRRAMFSTFKHTEEGETLSGKEVEGLHWYRVVDEFTEN